MVLLSIDMKTYYIIIIFFVFSLSNCNSFQNFIVNKGTTNDAIKNAIYDFVHTSKYSRKDSVFEIDTKNLNNEILCVSIFGSINKLYPNPENKIGTNYANFPTKYFEYENKLFYWNDSISCITDDLINILSEYNQIDSLNVHKFVEYPEMIIDDSKKGVDYYFCKRDLSKYKKVTTNMANGLYEPPKLKCE